MQGGHKQSGRNPGKKIYPRETREKQKKFVWDPGKWVLKYFIVNQGFFQKRDFGSKIWNSRFF